MLSQYSQFELANGLRVITIPMEGVSSVTAMVLVGAGGRYEEKENIGLSHFLEHMFFKGTAKRPTAFDIASLIDSVGGENNAFTGKDQTGFYIKVKREYLPLAMDILSDTLKNSLFLEEEINRERGTIIEEINMYEDTPLYKIDDIFNELMFDGHPLSFPVVGEKKTVKEIKREDFVKYTDRFYQGSDMVLAIAGKITPNEAKELAEKYFSSFSKGKKEEFVKFDNGQKEPRVSIRNKKTDQAHLYYGYPSFSFFDEDKYALEVLSSVLGGGMSSRLFIEVRERRGLAYYVHTEVDLYHETGFIAASAGLNLEKVEEAVALIRKEFEKTTEILVPAKELAKAKESIKGRLSLRMENSRSVADWFADKMLLEGKIETPEEYFVNIDKVTPDDIQRVAKRVFDPKKANLAIIGPLEDKEKLLKLIS